MRHLFPIGIDLLNLAPSDPGEWLAISPKEMVIRIWLGLFGAVVIMSVCGWISWRDGHYPELRQLGGLFGGLFLSGCWMYFIAIRYLFA